MCCSLVLLGWAALCAGHQMVAPGGMVPHQPAQPGRQFGGWTEIRRWPVGFFIAGSQLPGLHGAYEHRPQDHRLPRRVERLWVHPITNWAILAADGQWIIVDPERRDRLRAAGGSWLPPGGRSWRLVTAGGLRGFRAGDRATARMAVPGLCEEGEPGTVIRVEQDHADAPIVWRKDSEGGREIGMQAWRLALVGGDSQAVDQREAGEASDRLLPWQLVGIMNPEEMARLIKQQQEWHRGLRPKLPAPTAGQCPEPAEAAMSLCADGRLAEAQEQLSAALEGTTGHTRAAVLAAGAYCARRGGGAADGLERATLALQSAPDHPAALREQALALMDLSRYDEAIVGLERWHELEPDADGLTRYLTLAHTRARGGSGCAPVSKGFCVGQIVKIVEPHEGLMSMGDLGEVIGLGTHTAPIALQMMPDPRTGLAGRLLDVQSWRIAVHRQQPERPPLPDHYQILGLAADFSAVELKRAYRNASLEVHPDKRKGAAVEGEFEAVAEAHRVLSDEQLRQQWEEGEHLQAEEGRGRACGLREELEMFYWPERRGWRPFGDPFEGFKRQMEHDRLFRMAGGRPGN